ncbi:MAG: Ribulose bisphosphate carboxylase [Candidatus Methanolliviera sp. GoM_asphalt]|nr:MAG: Ribulose bisphosphate carboxylase [Candidatus Methanolliviera sp. GoM_asphalt]
MGMRYEDFVDLSYEPKESDLITEFYVEPQRGEKLKHSVGAVAAESSIGTWDPTLSTMREGIKDLGAKVFDLNEDSLVHIAYPEELFEPGNISQILSSVAGNIFGMKEIKNLRLLDIKFPETLKKSFLGPKFGIEGIKKLFNVERPLVGTIIKPKLGLNHEEHAKVAYDTWLGGIDIVKDDENLTNMSFNKFNERIDETLKRRDRAEEKTGEKKIYMPNITAPLEEMKDRARYVEERGGEYVMIDIVTCGGSALQEIRKYLEGENLVIHAHRAMHAAFTRSKKHGISMLVLAKIARLAGVDQLHTGTVIGKMEGGEETITINRELREERVGDGRYPQDWKGIKTVLPVASGGLHPGHVPRLIEILGKDIIIQAGGGVHGHPDGSLAGARALRESVDACMEGIELKKYAKTHEELKKAIEKWGVV